MVAVLFAAVMLFGSNSQAQVFHSGPQVATFYSPIDDSEQPYGLYLPPNYDAAKSYPLVVMLHGAMSNHRLALKRVFGKSNVPGENDAAASRYFQKWNDVDYIVASPYARGTMGYVGIPEADVMQVIDECRAHFNIDENRIFLTGLSMGGGGTFYIGLTHPDLFAALAPVCPAPPAEVGDLWGNALNLPISLHQGDADMAVRPEGTRKIEKTLRESGTMVEYHEYPGVGHNSWDNAYQNGNIFRWFDGITRNPFPQRVRYTTKWYQYNKAYWVTIDELTPGTAASVDAQMKGSNNVEITTTAIGAFTLSLNGHNQFAADKPLSIKVNGQTLVSTPKFNHSFRLINGKWEATAYYAAAGQKQKGLEGPMLATITQRHVVVYGTADNPSAEVLKQRRDFAKLSADYSVSFGGYEQPSLVNPRVIADKEVTDDDLKSSNLILIGTGETNHVIAKLSAQLPLLLTNDAKNHGLVYAAPVNGRMVLVCSGMPFWSPNIQKALNANGARQGIRFTQGTGFKTLGGLKDYLFFDETSGEIIAEGYFTTDWKLTDDITKKIKDSGVVKVNR